MADPHKISFKIYLTRDEDRECEVRRLCLEYNVGMSLMLLREKLGSIFPELHRSFCILWKDDEGEMVTLGSDEELAIAVKEMPGPVYKFHLRSTKKVNDVVKDDNGGEQCEDESRKFIGEEHVGVVCDGCNGKVVGFRYKCVQCPNFDLCSECEFHGHHSDHTMIRIASPQINWPQHFYPRLRKLHERMSTKWSACQNATGGEKDDDARLMMGGLCGVGDDGCNFRQSKEHSTRICHGNKWFEAMMKGWTGSTQEFKQKMLDVHKATHEAVKAADEAHNTTSGTSNGSEMSGNNDFLANVGHTLAAVLDPLGIDVQVDVRSSKKHTSKPNDNEGDISREVSAANEKEDGGKPSDREQQQQLVQATMVESKEEKERSNDGEDWTLVASGDGKKEGKSSDDEEEEENCVSNPLREAKLDPRVEVALQAMLNMGFTNSEGNLTKLLESTEGSIGEALDILQFGFE